MRYGPLRPGETHLIDDVLHGPVECDVVQGVRLVDHHLALRAVNVVLQVFDYAALAERVQTLGDGRCVHQVAGADLAGDHLVDAADVDLPLTRGDGCDGCCRVDHFHFCLLCSGI